MSKTYSVNTAGLDYETTKKLALAHEPVTARVKFSDMEIDKNGQMSVGGQPLTTDPGIYRQFLKILKLNPAFLKRFGAITDDKTQQALVDMIKSGLSIADVRDQSVTLIGNPTSQMITHIMPGHKDFISNRLALDVFERIANTYSDLKLNDFNIDGSGGMRMSFVTNKIITPFRTNKTAIDGEEFNAGLNLSVSTLGGIQASGYVLRLVCTNGAVINEDAGALSMDKLNERSLERFFEGIALMETSGFAPLSFNERLEKAMNINASFAELKDARNMIMNNSAMSSDDQLHDFLPEFGKESRRLASLGVDYAKCNDMQLQNWPVKGVKVWDVINRITDFGSHEYGFAADSASLQVQAGRMFYKKQYDAENLLPQLNLANIN